MSDPQSNVDPVVAAHLARAKVLYDEGIAKHRQSVEEIAAARAIDPKLSNRKIAEAMGLHHTTVGRLLKWHASGADRTSAPFADDERAMRSFRQVLRDDPDAAMRAHAEMMDSEPDDEPEVELPPAVLRPGDVVMMGDPPTLADLASGLPICHVLVCGDSELTRVALAGVSKKPRLLVSDPPYGIMIDDWDTKADWRKAWENFEGHHGFVFYGLQKRAIAQEALEAVGFTIADELVWYRGSTTEYRKPAGVRHRLDYIFRVEREGQPQHWVPDRQLDSPLYHPLSPEERAEARPHKTPKPVALIVDLIKSASEPSDVVLDPFGGSGSTLLACEETGRRCLAVEREPAYCDLIVRRWQTRTGRQAMLWQGGGKRDPIPVDDLRHDDGERHQPLVRESRERTR